MVQVWGSGRVVVLVVLSRRVAVAQSNWTVSGQVTLYQNDSVELPAGASNVCPIDELPLVGEVAPSMAANVPECGALVVTPVVPDDVQPARVPVSNPPLVMTVAADAGAAAARTMAAAPRAPTAAMTPI